MTNEVVRSVPFFASLPDIEIEQLSTAVEPKEVAAETLLLTEDEQGDHYYILVEGEVEVLKARVRSTGACSVYANRIYSSARYSPPRRLNMSRHYEM